MVSNNYSITITNCWVLFFEKKCVLLFENLQIYLTLGLKLN